MLKNLINDVKPLSKGAEADIYLKDGVVVKERVAKKYRHKTLDERIRRQRTKREAKNLETAAAAGVKVPKILRVDEKKFTLEMEYIPGELAKDLFESGKDVAQLSEAIGRQLRLMHDNGLVHNDLTTSNIIVAKSGVYFIDFGLAFHTARLEDKAMDLVVFKKSILATHTTRCDEIWENLIIGYKPEKETLNRITTIEKRVRYK